MVLTVGCLELLLAQKLNTVGEGTSNIDLLMLSRAVQQMKTGAVWTVSTFSSLPDASLNVGKLYFVQDVEELFWSNATYGWVSMFPGSLNTLWTWGRGNYGQLGTGVSINRSSPGTIAGGITTWCAISASSYHTTAIRADGTAWTWGGNFSGQLGNNTTNNRCSPGTLSGGGNTWCAISAGQAHTAAIKTDGTAWTWGSNGYGSLGNNNVTNTSSPGTVSGGGTNWRQISVGGSHTAAVKTDGTIWTWGKNSEGGFGMGMLGDNTNINRSSPGTVSGGGTTWCRVSTQINSTAAIKTDGTIWTWGQNSSGQLGDLTVVNRSSPVTIAGGGTNWRQISVGGFHTAAVKTDGTAWTWGSNFCGTLGAGTVSNTSSPGTLSGGGTNWCQISAGNNHTAAVKTDGTTWTWGQNICGQLGDLTLVNRSSPGTVSGGGTTWCDISAGTSHTTAIQSITF